MPVSRYRFSCLRKKHKRLIRRILKLLPLITVLAFVFHYRIEIHHNSSEKQLNPSQVKESPSIRVFEPVKGHQQTHDHQQQSKYDNFKKVLQQYTEEPYVSEITDEPTIEPFLDVALKNRQHNTKKFEIDQDRGERIQEFKHRRKQALVIINALHQLRDSAPDLKDYEVDEVKLGSVKNENKKLGNKIGENNVESHARNVRAIEENIGIESYNQESEKNENDKENDEENDESDKNDESDRNSVEFEENDHSFSSKNVTKTSDIANRFSHRIAVVSPKKTASPTQSIPHIDESHPEKCKAPVRHYIFLKTHKTASTTVSNICLRFAARHQLLVALPPEQRWELGAYPAYFNSRFVTPRIDTNYQKYEVMCHHLRYDEASIDLATYEDKKVFTILRDPVDNFESNFAFFRDGPYKQWLGVTGGDDYLKRFSEFLNGPGKFYKKTTPWYFRAKNYQAFDLGLEHENDSPDYINQAIAEIEHRIDLVMITEMFDESLILLKDLLCMEMDDIIYLKLKIANPNYDKPDYTKVQESDKDKIRSWNQLDTGLYWYFAAKLHQKIIDYGAQRMDNDLKVLRGKLKSLESHCVHHYEGFKEKPWLSKLILNTGNAQRMCGHFSAGEVKYGEELRYRQRNFMRGFQLEKQPKMKDLVEEMQEEQRKVLGEKYKFK